MHDALTINTVRVYRYKIADVELELELSCSPLEGKLTNGSVIIPGSLYTLV